jgi:hypothetical protein
MNNDGFDISLHHLRRSRPQTCRIEDIPKPPPVSETEMVILAHLRKRGPMTCTEIGEELWGGKRKRQTYARPAGRALHRLKRKGLVRETIFRGHHHWIINSIKSRTP